ncbi:MAG: hypothetical protein RLZZ292_478 [Bacteroidota bacterium]|jgi:hypothetical protein
MKYFIFLCFIVFSSFTIYGQNKVKRQQQQTSSLSIELIPVALMQSAGSGLNIQYGVEGKSRFKSLFSIGFLYNNSNTGHEREYFTSNGVPLAEWSTEVDIETTRPYPLGGVVNSNDFNNLDKLGIKQFKPKLAYRLNRYVSYEFLYKVLNKKLAIASGVGLTFGLTNRDDTHVGFTGTIENPVSGLSERFWVNINIRAKYLYTGATAKLLIDYPITDRLNLGATLGLHYIFDKNFSEDIKIPYLGLTTKIKI